MLTENGKENAITPYNFANKISLNDITLFIFPFFFFLVPSKCAFNEGKIWAGERDDSAVIG